MAAATEKDFTAVTNALGPNELQHLLHYLDIKQRDIENAEKSADTTDPRLKARKVLVWWMKKLGSEATREALYEAKRKALLSGQRDTSNYSGAGAMTLASTQAHLREYYRNEFGDICVINDQRSTEDLFLEPDLEYTVDGKTKRKLKSCDELLSIKLSKRESIEKYLLLVGRPGSGKSTVVSNRLAYDWAMGKKHNDISLLFVIDMGTITEGFDLLDIIDDQLLTDAKEKNESEFKKLLEDNAPSILFLVDGFSGAPESLKRCKYLSALLDRKWLQGSRVIVTLRPDKEADFNKSFKGFTSVSIDGFSNEIVDQYTEKAMLCNSADLVEFRTALLEYPPWLSWLRTNPLTLSMLCYLWKEDKRLPVGVTLLYATVIESLQVHQAHVETDEETEQALIDLGQFGLQSLLGEEVQVTEEEKDILKIPQCMGICSIQQERKRGGLRRVKSILRFPLHKSFQEYCVAKYIVSIVESNQDKFLSTICAIAAHENVLRFCCGLSSRSAYFILNHVVNKVKINTAANQKSVNSTIEDTCIFGIGIGVNNPWKLPLSLLFEADSQKSIMSEKTQDDTEYSLVKLHAIFEPIVSSFHIKCENWPVDIEMCYILRYFKANISDISWLSKVRAVSLLLEASNVPYTYDLVREQTSLVESFPSLEQLCIKSVDLEGSGNVVLDNLQIPSSYNQGSLKLVIAECTIDVVSLAHFLSHQVVSISVTLQSVLLCKKTELVSPIAIKSLREIIVSNCSSVGETTESHLSALLSKLKSPVTLKWLSTLRVIGANEEQGQECGHNQLYRSFSNISYPRRDSSISFYSELTMGPVRRSVTDEKQHGRLVQRHSFKTEAFTFNCFISEPLPNTVIAELILSQCSLNLKFLCNFLNCQQILRNVTLQDVILSGCLQEEYDFKHIKICSFINVDCRYNTSVFLCQFSCITNITLKNLKFTDSLTDLSRLKSLQNIEICNCELRDNICLFVSILPPFAMLTLQKVSFAATHITNCQGSANNLWVYYDSQRTALSDIGTHQSDNIVDTKRVISSRDDSTEDDNFNQSILQTVEPLLIRSDAGDVIPHCYAMKDIQTLYVAGSSSGSFFDISCVIPQRLQPITQLNCSHVTTTLMQLKRGFQSLPFLCKAYLQSTNVSDNAKKQTNDLTESRELDKQDQYDEHMLIGSNLKELHMLGLNMITGENAVGVVLQAFVSFLGCIPTLEKVIFNNVNLFSELGYISLKTSSNVLEVSSRNDICAIDVNTFVNLVSHLPPLPTVSLIGVNLTGAIDSSIRPLHDLLTEFTIADNPNTVPPIHTSSAPSSSITESNGTRTSLTSEKLDLSKHETKLATLMELFSFCRMLRKVTIKNITINSKLMFEKQDRYNENAILIGSNLRELHILGLNKETCFTNMITGENVVGVVTLQAFVRFLGCIPTLEKVIFNHVNLISELGTISLKTSSNVLEVSSIDQKCTMNVNTFVNLVSHLPPLPTVSLIGVNLTGAIDSSLPPLHDLLTEFAISGGPSTAQSISSSNAASSSRGIRTSFSSRPLDVSKHEINANTLMEFLRLCLKLRKVSIKNSSLNGELTENEIALSETLNEVALEDLGVAIDGAQRINQILYILKCMPKLRRIVFSQLTMSIENFMRVLKFVYEFQSITLQHVKLKQEGNTLPDNLNQPTGTHKTVNSTIVLKMSSNVLKVSSIDQKCTMNVNTFVNLVSQLPAVAKVSLIGVNLTGAIDSSIPPLHDLLTEFSISGNPSTEPSIHMSSASIKGSKGTRTSLSSKQLDLSEHGTKATTLMEFLRLCRMLRKVSITNITLIGELSENEIVLSDTLEELALEDSRVTLASTQSITKILYILKCMSKLRKIVLSQLTMSDENFMRVLNCIPKLESIKLQHVILKQVEGYILPGILNEPTGTEKTVKSPHNNVTDGSQDISKSKCLSNVKELDMSANNVKNIMPILASNNNFLKTINVLKLKSACLTASDIPRSLKHTKALHHLDISDNSIGSNGASALAQSFQHIPGLQHLNLRLNNIGQGGASALAESFQQIPALQHLYLSSNNIGPDGASALAQSFQSIQAIQHLNLSLNNIGSDGASTLAHSFQHIPALYQLHLSYNDIGPEGASALARSIQHIPALQHLNLSDNAIGTEGASALAESLQHIPALQHLDLSWNNIGPDGSSALAQSFQHIPALQHLNLSNNDIGPERASALAQSIQHIPALQHLNLSDNAIGTEGASALAESLQHIPALQHLDLSWNNIGPVGASALAQSFQHIPALQHLNLSDNEIVLDGASVFAQLIQHIPTLYHLHLSKNDIGPEGASVLAQSFQHIPALQHLDLSLNTIGPDGASALAQSIQNITALQHLELSQNYISSEGTSALALSFQHIPALQHLDLSSNDIGPDGSSALAKSFQHIPALQHLNLCNNGIGTEGASLLAQSFQHIPALQHLNLRFNEIDADGASAIAQSLQNIPALQHLDLTWNRIGPEGASALTESIRHIPALQHLDLGWNNIGRDGASALAQSIQNITALQHLDVSMNEIGSDGASAIAQSFQHIPALQHLDLSKNKIGPEGASTLAQSMQHIKALQHLNLGQNDIGSEGALVLAQSIQNITALQHLDLGQNDIGSDGASAFAQSFQHIPALQHLDLHFNKIGSDGASALAQSIRHIKALQHLNLSMNNIGPDGASALAQSIQNITALRHLDLSCNYIDVSMNEYE